MTGVQTCALPIYDAECCAQFAIHLLNGDSPDWEKVNLVYAKKKNPSYKKRTSSAKAKAIVSISDWSCADKNNPFNERAVLVTGDFPQQRSEIELYLEHLGADIKKGISKKLHFIFIGDNPGPAKLEKLDKLEHDGYKIKRLYKKDLDAIFSGNFDAYGVDKEISKDLDFTYNHYSKHKIEFQDGKNVIASKELYFANNLAGKAKYFRQIAGNLGAFGDHEIYPETNVIVLSDQTIEKLETGEKDDTILFIENHYNSNKSRIFQFSFISESAILNFCKERCEQYGDEVTMSLYEKYIESAIKKIEQNRYVFKDGYNHCKVDGKFVFKLKNGRSWCPSRQNR